MSPDVLSGLCSRLTTLRFAGCGSGLFSFASVPGPGWPRLRELHLDHIFLQPAALASLTQLEVLDLWDCELEPAEEVGGCALEVWRVCGMHMRSVWEKQETGQCAGCLASAAASGAHLLAGRPGLSC
jgi:hypothetical protein